MTFFQRDLNKEQLLGNYLDSIYAELDFNLIRVDDINSQHKGIDLIYKDKDNIYIDEKAQLDYINQTLPTFTFELSYLKEGKHKLGWLFDQSKITTHYFLVTGIHAKKNKDITHGVSKCIITSVNRQKLITHLQTIDLSYEILYKYEKDIRRMEKPNIKYPIAELNPKSEGLLFYSPHLAEKPINLQIRLNYLIDKGIAKRIYPIP